MKALCAVAAALMLGLAVGAGGTFVTFNHAMAAHMKADRQLQKTIKRINPPCRGTRHIFV